MKQETTGEIAFFDDTQPSRGASEPPSINHPPPTIHPRTYPLQQYSKAAVGRAIHLTGEQQPIRWLQCSRAGRQCNCLLFPATPGAKRAVPGRAISTLPPRRGGAPTPVLSPARRSAAVRMGRSGTARPREAEWSSGVAAFLGGCYNQDIFKDPFGRYYHEVIILYNKDTSTSTSIYQVPGIII